MAGASTKANKFSQMSELAGRRRPGRRLFCSAAAGWTSLLLQTYEQPQQVEAYESAPSPDPLVVMVLEGSYKMESFAAGSWKQAWYRPGMGGVTAPLTTNRLRWQSLAATNPVILRIYIPQQYFLEAGEEYRRAGERSDIHALDTLSFSDPMVCSVMKALADAAAYGAPDLYADAGARFLATHLLSRTKWCSGDELKRRDTTVLTDRRLARVLEFMQQHFADTLTVDQLAKEAGISRFHFTRLFRVKVGVTPHRHVVRLRMQRARTLLCETDLPVGDIAVSCGYIHHGHFSAAFAKEFGCSPAAIRVQEHAGCPIAIQG